ncbi:carboxylating nicotinate-nucleotide diphosphorylase [Zafaria sp. J156]|uniref:carboxylating nicotinate-nucleotide diphosphorylase n=1 Tax=Zafaria sp. J156 TaxID=3116490 RepID=UPI002E777B01|nr:carboxylating nicotinate-nucleotide diphosphorylase [Zafaria sp. J156]MEE1620796.1 carboxylating nicotinate-nucleotide diphosphorylase [Zafaria sp. J156]
MTEQSTTGIPGTAGDATVPSTAAHDDGVTWPVPAAAVTRIVADALAEDLPQGDLTAQVLVPAAAVAHVAVIAREPGVCAGIEVFREAMRQGGAGVVVRPAMRDGARFAAGDVLATASGPARAVLAAERVGLNLLQRLCGVATQTRALVDAAGRDDVRIADTRKTTPGLRVLERYAVRCGGGHNHRDNLSSAVMAKDNHLALLGTGAELTAALRAARARLGHTVHLEVEIDSLEQLEPVVSAGVDTVMLDNFGLEDLAEGVRRVAGRCLVEASGNVSVETVAAIAATGVDVISAGSITHSVRSLDLGLDWVGGA